MRRRDMWGREMRALAFAVMGAALAGCEPIGDVGYVEIKTAPSTTSVTQPQLYLDSAKVEPIKKGAAVLKQRVGTTKLAIDGAGGQLTLCEIVVKKNRITTVTVTVQERPPRCQCRNAGTGNRTCVS
jgi:hypothetical protein